MVRPRWKKVVRDVRLHKGRTILVILAIALGIVGAGSVLNTYSILRQVTREGYLATNPPSATLVTESIDDDLLASVHRLPSISEVQARREVSGRALVGEQWLPLRLFAMRDFESITIGLLDPERGAWPPAAGEIVIEHSSLPIAGVAPGDELNVTVVKGKEVRLPVTGVVRDPGLAPGWMEHVVYGYVTLDTLRSLGASSELDRLLLVAGDKRFDEDHVRRAAFRVKSLVEATGRRVVDLSVPTPGRHVHAAQMDSLFYVQTAFGLLALVLGGMLVVNLMAAILAGQVREIGVMKAVGARTGQVAGIYFGMVLILGLTASAVAWPIAGWIGRSYAGFLAGLLNFDITGYRPELWVTLLQFGVGALLPVVAAAIPVHRGTSVTVSDALRDYGIRDDVSRLAILDGILTHVHGPTRPLLLSLRNTFRRRFRLALTLLALATGGAVFLGALNLRASIRATVTRHFDALHYDLGIQFVRSYPTARLEQAISELPDPATAEAWKTARGAVVYADETQGNAFPIMGLPPQTTLVDFPLLAGRWLEPDDTTALVVNNQLIDREPQMGVGKTITLAMGGEELVWTVVGIVISSPTSPVAYANRDVVAASVGEAGTANRAVVATRVSDRDRKQLLEAAFERGGLEVSSSQLVAEARAIMEDHLLMVANFLLVMALVSMMVGGLGLATTMSLAVLERTREIGVLRAIGAPHRTIRRIVIVEGLVIGILSSAIAVPLSLPMSAVVGNAFGRIMFQAPIVFVTAPSGLAIWMAVMLVLSTLASLYPAWIATGLTTSEALAYG